MAKGNLDKSRDYFSGALDKAKTSEADGLIAKINAHLEWLELKAGNLSDAQVHGKKALLTFKDQHDPRRIDACRLLGVVATARGDRRQARELLGRARQEARRLHKRTWEAACLNDLGDVAKYQGDTEASRRYFNRYRKLQREMNADFRLELADKIREPARELWARLGEKSEAD